MFQRIKAAAGVATQAALFFFVLSRPIHANLVEVPDSQYQPQIVTLESHPSRRSAGIISLPEGSPWCGGNPTIWLPGHKDRLLDEPNCLIKGKWKRRGKAFMDIIDKLNMRDGAKVIDRHDCGVMDINNDGLMDIYCSVGANRGQGIGYNEVYLTKKKGGLFKIRRHGLQKFIGQRTRHTTVLKGSNGTEYVFISASYGAREDGLKNKHAMFIKNNLYEPVEKRYFSHVRGPWRAYSNTSCALSVDINGDGLDDLILCNERKNAMILVQKEDGWGAPVEQVHKRQTNWRQARVADLDGDGLPELAVVYHSTRASFLRVFQGIPDYPYFRFDGEVYYGHPLPYAAPDLEILDVDGDGNNDIYIVQIDEHPKNVDGTSREDDYCSGRLNATRWWKTGETITDAIDRITPSQDFVPPNDVAQDLLLIGKPDAKGKHGRFRVVTMEHSEPGCGYFVKKFGAKSIVLAQGGFDRPGHQLLLQW